MRVCVYFENEGYKSLEYTSFSKLATAGGYIPRESFAVIAKV